MAEEKDEVFDKKAARKAEKAQKKADKKGKKSKKNELEEEETTVGGKIAVFFVTLIILLIWLAIIVLLIKWDVGGFGSTMLAPILKDVPYVNRILPENAMEELSTEESAYAYSSMEEAVTVTSSCVLSSVLSVRKLSDGSPAPAFSACFSFRCFSARFCSMRSSARSFSAFFFACLFSSFFLAAFCVIRSLWAAMD